MKRFLSLIFAIFAASTLLFAQDDMGLSENQTVVGHTLTNEYSEEGAYIGEPDTYTIGARLSAAQLAPYAGCRIVGMRVASVKNQAATRVFVYNTADLSEPLHEQKNRLFPGWTNVIFNGNGIDITGDEDLFFGYDYVETPEMASAEIGTIAITGSDTPGGFVLLSDKRLIEISEAGCLCVQLIIDITNMPHTNLAFTFTDTGFKYKKAGEKIALFAQMANVGRDNVDNFSAEVTLDGKVIATTPVDLAIKAGGSETWQTEFTMPESAGIGSHNFTVAITEINGREVERRPSSTLSTKFAYYNDFYPRKRAYVEAFSSQQYALSPTLDNVIDDFKILDGAPASSIVKVYEPGTPLAVADAADLWELYAYDIPVFSINRSLFVGEKNVAYCLNDYLVLPHEVLLAVFNDLVMQDIQTPSFADIDLSADFDRATSTLNVKAELETLPELKAIYGETVLKLMLVEDGIKNPQGCLTVSGDVTVNNNYIHNDVLRAYIGAPEGIDIEPNDNMFTANLNVKLDTSLCNPDNCRVVAIIVKKGTPTATDIADYDIVNAEEASLRDASGVEAPEAEAGNVTYRWFTTDGVEVKAPAAGGLYIRIGSDGSSRKILR